MRGGPGGMGPGLGGRGAPPPGYNNYSQAPYGQGAPPRDQSPYGQGNRGVSPQAPAAIGQAIEMDSRTGTPPVNQNQNYGLRESDGDVQGMLALQQGGFPSGSPQRRPSDGVMSPTSSYSQE